MVARRTTMAVALTAALLATAVQPPGTAAGPKRADLAVTKLGTPPAKVKPGASFGLAAVVANGGRAAAPKSSLRFYLSKDRKPGAGDIVGATVTVKGVKGTQRTALRAAATLNGRIKVPASAQGSYWVIACADPAKKVRESKETNNCRISKTRVIVDADVHATLTGTLTFLDAGQRTDPSTGSTKTWNHTGSATIAMTFDGDPNEDWFVSTGSSYERSGTVTDHDEDENCVRHDERKESGSGTLTYTGAPFTDDIHGSIGNADLSEIQLGVDLRAAWTQTNTYTGRGDLPCDDYSKTTTGAELSVNDIELERTSTSGNSIHYKVKSFVGEMNTASDWQKVEGDLVLTLR